MASWNQESLEALIGTPEGLHMEFKSNDLLATRARVADVLTKEVSAFANADGGTIVIGLDESRDVGPRVASGLSEAAVPDDVSVGWLNQAIQDNLSPQVFDLRVLHVSGGGAMAQGDAPARAIGFVVEVPRQAKAIQAKDNVFYQRQEDRSVPMKAYQIDDVNNRTEGPDLELALRLRGDQPQELVQEARGRTRQVVLEVVVRNRHDTVVEHARFRLAVPRDISRSEPKGWVKAAFGPKMVLHVNGEWKRDATAHIRRLEYPGGGPALFKGMEWEVVGVFGVQLRDSYEHVPHYEPVLLVAQAPRMRPRLFELVLQVGLGDALSIERIASGSITFDELPPLDYLERQ